MDKEQKKIIDLLNQHPELLREWDVEAPVELPLGAVGFLVRNYPHTGWVWIAYDEDQEAYDIRVTEQEAGMYLQICFVPESELMPVLDKMIKGDIGEEDIVPMQLKWISGTFTVKESAVPANPTPENGLADCNEPNPLLNPKLNSK